MEMCDPTSEQAKQAEQEKTLNPEASASVEVQPNDAIEVKSEENTVNQAESLSKEALLEQARVLLEKDPAEIQRDQLGRLRQHFTALRKEEVDEARTAFAEAGNDPEAFTPVEDAVEIEFNEIINQVREKKNAWAAAQEQQRQDNLKEKNEIIDKINALASDTDNVNRTFPEYRDLQDKFNSIGEVPPTEETNIWKRFQEAREHYSDNLKINKELRDYDFKKNLDAKELLISEAINLDNESDVITAFRRLQDLHDKWRQIGPVAKELREEIWQKFKDASAAINKKYQAFFEERKARETEAEEAKIALCEQIEALDFTILTSFSAWDQMTAQIIELQNKWKEQGFAPRKVNNSLFTRFRQRCDEFFTKKAEYFKSIKEEYANNLAKKQALAQRAEELKDSTEWRKVTDLFVAMQKEWKTIGAVPKKHSDNVWKRFQTACDYFFEQKKKATSGQRTTEQANLKAKRQVIADLEALSKEAANPDSAQRMHELQDKWAEIGHVPFRDKDQINDAYRAAINALRKVIKTNDSQLNLERFETNLSQIGNDQGKLLRERDRLARALENRRNEIRTYENNLGFLTLKSKSGNSIVQDLQAKIERLRQDINDIQDKISLIDSKLQ